MGFFHRERLERHFSQGMRFAVVGGIAAMIELITVTILVEIVHIDASWAGGLSLIPSVMFVFIANKHFTFKAGETGDKHEISRFVVVYGFAIIMNYLLFSFFLHALNVDYRIAKALAIGIIASWNYLLSHVFVFKKRGEVDPAVGI